MKLNQQQVQHFYLRGGFGQPIQTVKDSIGESPEAIFEAQASASQKLTSIDVALAFKSFSELKEMSPDMRMKAKKEGRKAIKDLNVLWVKEMVTTSGQLREKMAFFWHDHFACKSGNPYFMQDYLAIIREHALGNFGELLKAISKSPAMLQYLNNQQNKKKAPNENFAREVMELFTLGRDKGYTEKDISEAARAFTGWSFNKEGEFVERVRQHDNGIKSVLGKSGPLNGDDVIDLLLAQKQTATYISQKWVRFFMNYDGDIDLERRIADELFRTGYDIMSGLTVLFTSPRFYSGDNIGRRIKSPIELIVGMQRHFHLTIQHEQSLIFLQRTLGQLLFDPPNVAGWTDGPDWVDSATLMFRLNLPQLVFRSALIQNQFESFDDNDNFKVGGQLKKLRTTLDEEALKSSLANLSYKEMVNYLLQTDGTDASMSGDFIDQIVHITSKPEYQLC